MTIKKFNIPSDFRKVTIDHLAKLNNEHENAKVTDVYGNITKGNYFTSGRDIKNLPLLGIEELSEYVKYAKQNNIQFNYTFNATHMNNNEFKADTIKKFKYLLYDIFNAGVTTVIVTLPALYEIIRSTGLKFKIKTSVLSEITSANKAMACKGMGADKIVTDESITRDIQTLKQIVDVFGSEVELIANTWCISHCQYRMYHYNQMASEDGIQDSSVSNSFYPNRCYARILQDISMFLKCNWIRPEDLKYYSEIGINNFKLQGRHLMDLNMGGNRPSKKGDLLKTIEAYLNETYDGNLLDLLVFFNPAFSLGPKWDNKKLEGFIKPFFEKDGFCKKNCSRCNYCENFAKKIVNVEEFKKQQVNCRELFGSVDPFQALVWEGDTKKPVSFPL